MQRWTLWWLPCWPQKNSKPKKFQKQNLHIPIWWWNKDMWFIYIWCIYHTYITIFPRYNGYYIHILHKMHYHPIKKLLRDSMGGQTPVRSEPFALNQQNSFFHSPPPRTVEAWRFLRTCKKKNKGQNTITTTPGGKCSSGHSACLRLVLTFRFQNP